MSYDPFSGYPNSRGGPFDNVFVITPSDDQDLPFVVSNIRIADDNQLVPIDPNIPEGEKEWKKFHIHATTSGGDEVVFNAYGGMHVTNLRFKKIWATGTTATKLIGLY